MGLSKQMVGRTVATVLVLIFCCGVASVSGTTYWVSVNGSDANDGLDSTTAWATVDRGQQLGILVPGDSVNIMSGIYTFLVDIHLTTGGTSALPIVYRGLESNKYRAVLDGGGSNASFYIDQKHLRVESLEITNTSEHGVDVTGDSSTVVDCYIHGVNKSGIYLEGSWNVISRNRITATGDHGIENRDSGTNNRIYNNTIALCNKNGVECQGNVYTARIINNVLVRNDKGIHADALNLAAHNDVWGNASADYDGGLVDSAGGKSVDPGLISPQTGNFDLKDGSPAIDAGMDLGYAYTGSAPDMGAIEHVSHTPTVYYVSITGNDKLDGLTPATAWQHFDYADGNGLLYPGDTLVILGGVFASGSTMSLRTPGTASQPIVYIGSYDSTTTIDGLGTANPLVLLEGSHTVFSKITVTGADKAGIWTAADSTIIRECTISDNGEDGVYVEGVHTLLERNLIVSNSRHGIHSRDLGTNSWFYGNTIYGSGQKGIEFQANSISARIFNNIICGNDKGIDGKITNICGFNDVWNNSGGDYNGGVVDSAGGIGSDPLFIDSAAGDFGLQEASPCIDRGIDLGYSYLGTAPEMGSIEFVPIEGNVYWVSPTGDDSNDGLDSTSAWRSIQNGELLGVISPGDTVNVLPGVYSVPSAIHLHTPGIPGHNIVYRKFGVGTALFDAQKTLSLVFHIDASHISLEGISAGRTKGDVISIHGAGAILRECVIFDASTIGIDVRDSKGITVQRCVVYDIGTVAIKTSNNADSALIYGNTVHDAVTGIQVLSSASNARIFNNLVDNCGTGISAASTNKCGFNNIWAAKNSDYSAGAVDSAGGISVDPQFVDAATHDFNLTAASQCINAGLPIGYSYLGSAPEIGALEFDPTRYNPPVLAPIGPQSIEEGQNLLLEVSATDPDGSYPALTARNLPDNASFVDHLDGTATFTFEPDYTQTGTYEVTFYAGGGVLVDSEVVTITVTPAPVVTLAVKPNDLAIDQLASQQFSVLGYDAGGEFVADLTDSVVWSTTDPLGSITAGGLYTAGAGISPPNYQVIATYNGSVVDSSTVTIVLVASVLSIRVELLDGTPVNDTSLTTDVDDFAVYCRGYGIGNVLIGDVAATWRLVGADSIGIIDTVPNNTTMLELRRPGIGQIVATAGILVDSTGTITCTAGAPAKVAILPDSATVTTDSSLDFTYNTLDADGNTTEFQVVPTWDIIGSIGTIDAVGHFDPTTAGMGRIVLSGAGLADTTGEIRVLPGVTASMAIIPDAVSVARGDTVVFSTTSTDADGNSTYDDAISWSVLGRMGTIDASGLFVATRSGWGRVIAQNAAAGLIDTTGQIIVEAVEVSAIPLGGVVTNPGAFRALVMALHCENYYQSEKTIDSLTVHLALHGMGSIYQKLSNIDSIGIYVDSDHDSLLTDNDSLVAMAAADADSITFWPASISIPADSAIDLMVGCRVGDFAADGDSLDLFVRAGDIVFTDATVSVVADSINSLGYTVVDGALASEYALVPRGNGTLTFVDSLSLILSIDIPRNGYRADTLTGFALSNVGTAGVSNFDSLVLFVDGGDSLWTGASDETSLGTLKYTGDRWNLSGLSQPLVDGTTRFYIAAMVNAYPVANQTFVARIPLNGIEVRSGNDGPLNSAIESTDTLTIESQESIYVSGASIAAHPVSPGAATGPMLGIEIVNSYLHPAGLDSVRFHLQYTNPDGASQAELDSQIDSVAIYANHDGDYPEFGSTDSLLATGVISNGAVVLDMGGRLLADRGFSEQFTLQTFTSRYSARDGNTINIGLESAGDLFLDSSYARSGTYPIYNSSAVSISGFNAGSIVINPVSSRNLSPGGAETVILDFELPRNGYIIDSLATLEINNTGTFDDNALTLDLILRVDASDNGFTADDPILGRLAKVGSRWRLSNLQYPLATNSTRFVITTIVKESQAEGGSLKFDIVTDGATYASGTNGPDDAPIGNPQSHLVLPSNRITTIGIPVTSTPTAPGSEGNVLLSFALYNGYVGQAKTLDLIRLTNISRTKSSAAHADFETGQIQLYYDRNHDRQFNGDSLLGTGYMDNGTLLITGLGIGLAPESLSYFFVVGDLPLALIDGDSLAVSIDNHSDLSFGEQVSLNGDVPIVSGGFAVVDGSIASQYNLHAIPNRTLSPGDADVAVFSFEPAVNGNLTDLLQTVTLENLGTATASDFSSVELWYDKNDDGAWQPTDSLLGTMSALGSQWTLNGINMSIQGSAPTLCAVVDISAGAAAARTIRFSLPIDGCTYASTNDGPIDAPLSNRDAFSISYSGLSVKIVPLEQSYSVGQMVEVRWTATNLAATTLDSVVGEMVTIDNPSIVTLDSAVAGPISLGGSASSDFAYYYTAVGSGSIQWSMRAISQSTADTSAILQSKVVSIQSAPGAAIVTFNDAIPTAVTRGQANVFPLSIGISHPGTVGVTASLKIDSLTLTVEDGSGNAINADEVVSRVTLATGQATLATLDTIPASANVVLRFLQPLNILPGSQQLLSVLVDIGPAATSNQFALALTDAASVSVVDANSDFPVPLDPSLQFPARTASCRIDDPSDELLVSTVNTLGQKVNRGQTNVAIIQLDLRHPGSPTSSQVQLSALSMRFVDGSLNDLMGSQLLDRLSIVRNQFVIGNISGISLDQTQLTIPLTAPVTLNPGENTSLYVVGDISTIPSTSGFAMIIDDSTQFVVRDVSSGARLKTATDTTILATGSAFPISSTVAQLKEAAIDPTGCISSLLAPSVITGSKAQSLLELTIDYPVGTDYSPVHLDYLGIAVADSTGGPVNSQRLFDQIGYGIDGGAVTYLPTVSFIGALTQFSLGDSGLTIDPGSSHTVRLYADIEADPAGIDNFRLLIPDMAALSLVDGTDPSQSLNLATQSSCTSSVPFTTSLASVISRAGRPSLVVNKTPVRLAARGQTNVTLLATELNYHASGSEGNLSLESISARLVKRNSSAAVAAVPSSAFADWEILVDGAVVPGLANVTADTIAIQLTSGYLIEAGATVQVVIRCDVTANAELGNYYMMLNDSLSVQLTDAALATAIVPVIESGSLPLISGEVSITDVSLANSFSNYPNPFNPTVDSRTTIAYTLSEEARIDIDIYTITGDLVTRLTSNTLRNAGSHQEDTWNGLNDMGRTVSPGTYYCRITAHYLSGKSETLNRKVAVLR